MQERVAFVVFSHFLVNVNRIEPATSPALNRQFLYFKADVYMTTLRHAHDAGPQRKYIGWEGRGNVDTGIIPRSGHR
jgi:hypothetical protein